MDVKCLNCHYWVKEYEDEADPDIGDCRRYPPTYEYNHVGNFPACYSEHWCGEFKERSA